MFCSIDYSTQYAVHVIISVNRTLYWSLRLHCRMVAVFSRNIAEERQGTAIAVQPLKTSEHQVQPDEHSQRTLVNFRHNTVTLVAGENSTEHGLHQKQRQKHRNRNFPNSEEPRSDLLLIVYGQQLFTATRLSYNLYCLQCMAYHASILQLLPWSAFGDVVSVIDH